MASLLDRLAERQLLIVTGKGGVGKSTVSAALGRRLARHGRRTLLMEVDPRESLHRLLSVPPSGGEIVPVSSRLAIQHLDARGVLDDLVRDRLKVRILVDRVLASPVHRHFTEGAPGLKETAVFGRALRLLDGHVPRRVEVPQVVVLDAPATGHGVSWMAAPQLVSDVISSGPIGHMSAEIAAFLADPQRSAVVVVTQAEEMPIQETLELVEEMRQRLDRRPELVVVNGLYPDLPDDFEPEPDDLLGCLWAERRTINERELQRLTKAWSGPTVYLPLVAADGGLALTTALERELAPQIESDR